ncbi:hypothetical protein BGV67_14505 [Burkholderia ubonensis]|uniref:DUF427 domain-containing protein n=1 Tax=Burkholderia ubonensis TaxID=101571 RepID=UPI00075C6F4E|nr:DUF427 domain-containing protein [Burkholderia ubonensis]KVA73776.1 hypothetical protein WM36_17500 [Burkholderia ubonensis]KVC99710.1 hypothetical protein WI77_04870 [Burkholderia ubonensis]KVD52532.1 hypothetical protein WI85_10765 [Burkholderia ubonensis]KVO47576.1 hypothetical protein WJ77_25950 [Burkholderia ubonensis]KVO74366.1 hypothetical protein WJ79_16235 [Burkholderia ubonensis]
MTAAADPRLEIVPNRHRVRVIHRGITYADTLGALTVRESGLPDVYYLPRADVNMSRLVRSRLTTVCGLKGQASYFDLQTEDGVIENAAWSYEEPKSAALALARYVAFDAARVDSLVETS